MEKSLFASVAPESVGIPSKAVGNLLDSLKNMELCMHSLLIVKNGKIAAEGYWKPYDAEKKHRMYSISKSFVSVAIGLLNSEGMLALDDKIASYFPEKLPAGPLHPYIEATTIRDMLKMASPHEKTTYKLINDKDWVKTFFECPPSHLPGTVFSYDTSATTVLCALVEKLSGTSLLGYLYPRLLTPIGFSPDCYCLKTPLGVSMGGSGIMCTPRDLARFAHVCMRGGEWNGTQLLPRDYIKAATSFQIDNSVGTASGVNSDSKMGYGYKFWLGKNNSFAMRGMGGQLALCLPDKDTVIVMTADLQANQDGQQQTLDAIWACLYPFISENELEPNPADCRELTEKLENLSLVAVDGCKKSEWAAKANAKIYKLDQNAEGFKNVRFDFEAENGTMELENENGKSKIKFGMGKNICFEFEKENYACAASAAWKSESSLHIALYSIGEEPAPIMITAAFKDDTVTILMRNYCETILPGYSCFVSGRMF